MSKAPRPSIDESDMDESAILSRARFLSRLQNKSLQENSAWRKNESISYKKDVQILPDLCEIDECSSDVVLHLVDDKSPLIGDENNPVKSPISPLSRNRVNIEENLSKSLDDPITFMAEVNKQQREANQNESAGTVQSNKTAYQSISNFEHISNWLDQTSAHNQPQTSYPSPPKTTSMSLTLDMIQTPEFTQAISEILSNNNQMNRDVSNVFVSPNAPRISSPTNSTSSMSSFPNSFNRNQDLIDKRQRNRGRSQVRDKFSIRIVNFSCRMDPSRGLERRVFVTFQAQFPRQNSFHISNIPQLSTSFGVKLTLCCALDSNGPSLNDFKSPNIRDRLNNWELCYGAGKVGFCEEVLSSLKGTIEKILLKLNQEGISSMPPNVEYQFYPDTGKLLLEIPQVNRIRHLSTSSDSGVLQQNDTATKTNIVYEKKQISVPSADQVESIGITNFPANYNEQAYNDFSSQSTVNTADNMSSQLSQFLYDHKQEAAAQTMTSVQQSLNERILDTLIRHSSIQDLSSKPPHVKHYPVDPDPHNEVNRNNLIMKLNELINNISLKGNNSHLTEKNQEILRKVERALISLQNPQIPFINNHYQRKESLPSLSLRNDQFSSTSSLKSDPKTRILYKFNEKTISIKNIINEVAKRLCENPNLPLVIMPGVDNKNEPNSLPYIFQLNNATSTLIGIPGQVSGQNQPRVVTAPMTSTVVVTSNHSDPSIQTNDTGYLRVLPQPKVGHCYVINSKGQVFQHPEK